MADSTDYKYVNESRAAARSRQNSGRGSNKPINWNAQGKIPWE